MTERQLRRIINEEINNILNEAPVKTNEQLVNLLLIEFEKIKMDIKKEIGNRTVKRLWGGRLFYTKNSDGTSLISVEAGYDTPDRLYDKVKATFVKFITKHNLDWEFEFMGSWDDRQKTELELTINNGPVNKY